MVEIQCPHCDETVELENDVSGLFDCPHCEEEFSWESENDDTTNYVENDLMQWWHYSASGSAKIGIVINAIGIIVFIGFALTQGFDFSPSGGPDIFWTAIPMLIWIIGSLVMLIPFLFRKFEDLILG